MPGLQILPSNIRLACIAQSLYMRPKREELLKRGLDPILGLLRARISTADASS